MARRKIKESLDELEKTLKFYNSRSDEEEKHFAFLSVSKAFEVAVEYAWKELKLIVENEGLEAPSPKEAIRQAAKTGLVEDAKIWFKFIEARNLGIHDYFGTSEEEYLEIINKFTQEANKIFT